MSKKTIISFCPSRLFLAICLIIAALPFSSLAQGPVQPKNDAVAGYIRLLDPVPLAMKSEELFRQTALYRFLPAIDTFLARWLNDPQLRMALPARPVSLFWLQGPAGDIHHAVMLPKVADQEYLKNAAGEWSSMTRGAVTIIGSEQALALTQSAYVDMLSIHDAVHPSDISLYLTNRLWTPERIQKGIQWLQLPELTAFQRFTRAEKVRETSTLLQGLDKRDSKKANVPIEALMALRALQDVRMIHILMNPAQEPQRIIINLEAEPESPLASFLNQEEAESNAYTRYLPEKGALRAGFNIDLTLLEPAVEKWLADVVDYLEMDDARREEARNSLTRLLFHKGKGAIVVHEGRVMARFNRSTDAIREWLLLAIDNSNYTMESTQRLKDAVINRFPPGPASPGANRDFVAIVRPHSGMQDLPRITKALEDRGPGRPDQPVKLVRKAQMIEEFRIDQYFRADAPSTTEPEIALLSICKVNELLVLSKDYSEMLETMRNILRMSVLNQSLLAHREFIPGGHFYGDIFLPKDLTQVQDTPKPLLMMIRMSENRAQLTLIIP
ncbi:MAG: hypothetical protein ACLFUS_05190 [Candidatus Sumerlaeia bacterium]